MPRIPTRRATFVSQAVGTPGVDTSTAELFSTIGRAVEPALQEQRAVFKAAERQKKQIEAHSVANSEITKGFVEDINPLIQQVKANPEYQKDPNSAISFVMDEAGRLFNERGINLTPEQQAVYAPQAQQEVNRAINNINTWTSRQTRDNAINARVEQTATLLDAAKGAQSPDDFMELYNRVSSVANGAVLGDAAKFEQQVQADMIDEYFYGNYNNNPQEMLDQIDKGILGNLADTRKLKEYRGVAERRLNNQIKEKQLQATSEGLEGARGDSVALLNGEMTRPEWSRKTAQLQVAGADPKVISFRDSLERHIFDPQAEEARQKKAVTAEIKLAQSTKVADLLIEWTDIYSMTRDENIGEEDVLKATAEFYDKVGASVVDGEISQKQYAQVAKSPLRELNRSLTAAKTGGWFSSGVPKAIRSFRKDASNQTENTVEQKQLLQKNALEYFRRVDDFETKNKRQPSKQENVKIINDIKMDTAKEANPSLDAPIPKGGQEFENPSTKERWIVYPDGTHKYLGRP